MAPLYWYTNLNMTRPYVTRTFGAGSRQAFEKWDIVAH